MRVAPWVHLQKTQRPANPPQKKAKRKKGKGTHSTREGATTRKDPPRSTTTGNNPPPADIPPNANLQALALAASNNPGIGLPGLPFQATLPTQSPSVAGGTFVLPPVPPEITTTAFHSVAGNFAGLQDDWSVAEATIRSQAHQIALLRTQIAHQDMSTTGDSSTLSGKKRKAEFAESTKTAIRLAVKTKLFRTTKFVSSEGQCLQVAIMTLAHMKTPDCFEVVEGKSAPTEQGKKLAQTYSAYILKLLNETRQYASTQIKTAFFSRWDAAKEVLPINLKEFIKILQRDEDVDMELFQFYWDELLPKAEGFAKLWHEELRYFGLISTFAPEDAPNKPYITPSTEAWLVLCIENCAARWPVLYKQKRDHPGEKVVYSKKAKEAKPGYKVMDTSTNKDFVGKYTTTDAGQKAFGGWSKEGLQRYKVLLNMCKQGRAKATTRALEQRVLDALREKHGITTGDWKSHSRMLRGGTGDAVEVEEIEGLVDDDEWNMFAFEI